MSAPVPTSLGRSFVTDSGSGPVVVLYHSLFVDQRSWELVVRALKPDYRLVLIDAPNHGRSDLVAHDFTIADCAAAAGEVLDHLGITAPVNWVGNALGGHIGIILAATQPARIRSLVTIGTPVEPFGAMERWTKIIPLVQGYRLLGANRLLTRPLMNALLGDQAAAAQPEQAKVIAEAFRNADRAAMVRAMRCLMLKRQSVADLLPSISAPALMLVAERGQEGWTPANAEAAVATMPNGKTGTLPGFGHIAPLLLDVDGLARTLEDFWAAAGTRPTGAGD